MRKLTLAVTVAWSLGIVAGMRAQTQVDLRRQGRNVDFSGAERTKPFKTGSVLPSECELGEVFYKQDAPAGRNVFVCGLQNTWLTVGQELPGSSGSPGELLVTTGSGLAWQAPGGDVAGPVTGLRVQGLQGRALSSNAPNDGDVLSWSGTLQIWQPRASDSQYEAGAGILIAGRSIGVDEATVPVYSTGVGAPTGNCQPGRDYYVDLGAERFYYCTGANAWRSAEGGSLTAAWGSITGDLAHQSDLWGVLAGKADVTHSHTLGGDLSGNFQAATVTRLQNRPVSATAPADGQALIWDQTSGQWRPGNVTSGSSGWDPMDPSTMVLREDFCSGATTSGQVGVLGWTRSVVQGTGTGPDYGKGAGNNPCTVSIGVSTTNANDGATLNLGLNQSPFHDATGRGNWEAVFIWQYQDATTELRTRVGLTQFDQHNVLVPSNFMGLRLDHEASWDPGGTTFIACVCNGNTKANCTDYDTGVTVSQGTWYKLRLWSDGAGVVRMQVNDGAVVTFNNPGTLPSATTDFQPVWIMGRTGGTGSRRLQAEFFAARVTGLAR